MSKVVKQHVPIFVSSTFKDLQAHRSEVQRRLVGLEQVVKGMEYFGSNPDTPIDVCFKQISESKLFILLVGVSYGSIVPSSSKSFTQIEYEYAISKKIPILAYFADVSSIQVGIPLDNFDVKNYEKLKEFKEIVSANHTISVFSSIDDLGRRIAQDVPRVLREVENVLVDEMKETETITEDMLIEGAKVFESFFLRPLKYAGKIVPIRCRINNKWGGWKVKDELVRALNLKIGDTISTKVAPLLMQQIIDEDNADLFASGEGADWLLNNEVKPGSIIECYVQLCYCKAPVAADNRSVYIAAMVFIRGSKVVGFDSNFSMNSSEDVQIGRLLSQLRGR